jgi:hypothetical protein
VRGKKAVEPPVIAFLKSRAVDAFLKAQTPDALKEALAAMTPADRRVAEAALASAAQRRFFHWELEFAEVFYGPRPATERTIERLDGAGFDAVVGNPPYVRQEALKQDKDWYQQAFANTYNAANDLYVFFIEREIEHLRPNGLVGLIVADKWLRADYGRKLRKYLTKAAPPVSLVDFGHSPIFHDADTFRACRFFGVRWMARQRAPNPSRRPRCWSAGFQEKNTIHMNRSAPISRLSPSASLSMDCTRADGAWKIRRFRSFWKSYGILR